MSGPDAVGHRMPTSCRTSTPFWRTMRRVAAFVQLPAPHGVTERSWVIPTTTVAAPKPSTVPLPVLMSWKAWRSAIRLVIDAVLSEKLASRRFASFEGPAAACSARPLASAIRAITRSGILSVFFTASLPLLNGGTAALDSLGFEDVTAPPRAVGGLRVADELGVALDERVAAR